MFNKTAYNLGAAPNPIRQVFEYGRRQAALVGPENVFDFSLGNPSIPAPPDTAIPAAQAATCCAVRWPKISTAASGGMPVRRTCSSPAGQPPRCLRR